MTFQGNFDREDIGEAMTTDPFNSQNNMQFQQGYSQPTTLSDETSTAPGFSKPTDNGTAYQNLQYGQSTQSGQGDSTFDESKNSTRNYAIFRQKYALLLNQQQNGVMFDFRVNPNEDGSKSFPKDFRTLMMLTNDEVMTIVKFIDRMFRVQEGSTQILHNPNANNDRENIYKTLRIAKTPEKFEISLSVTTNQNKKNYYVSLGMMDAYLMNLYLKLWIYENLTGSRVGFTYNWL